jgi:membrane-bound metal-dependent hydrolase YbcI (DUF457 family)
MNKEGHTWGAIGAGVLTGFAQYKLKLHTNVFEGVALYSAIYFGSFAPDIDADYSYIRSRIPVLPTVYTAIQKTVADVPPLNNVFKHRGALTHSLWTLIILAIPLLLLWSSTNHIVHLGTMSINITRISMAGLIGCMIGCFGHHVLDMTTPAGLHYLYPFTSRRRR